MASQALTNFEGHRVNLRDLRKPEHTSDLIELFDAMNRLDLRMRMLLRPDGMLLAACSNAAEVLESGTCLRLMSRAVEAAHKDYRKRFRALLTVDGPKAQTLAVPCEANGDHLMVRAAAVGEDMVCVHLHYATESIRPELPDLQEILGLTKTEAMIAQDLFLGRTPQEIARDHDNSIHTVRAHIRRCYDKLGITRREELWSKLNAYRVC